MSESEPPLVLVRKIEGHFVERNKAKLDFEVHGLPEDDGEFEFVVEVRVPAADLARSGDAPLVATLRRDVHVISAEMKAIGGTPLAGERVVAVDPDSDEPIGEPVEADERGRVSIPVPENKRYHLRIVEDEDPLPSATEELPDDHDVTPVLAARFLDASGAPLAGETAKITGEGGFSLEVEVGEHGEIEPTVDAGPYEVEVRGEKFQAHTLLMSEVRGKGEHYDFVVGAHAEGEDATDYDAVMHRGEDHPGLRTDEE